MATWITGLVSYKMQMHGDEPSTDFPKRSTFLDQNYSSLYSWRRVLFQFLDQAQVTTGKAESKALSCACAWCCVDQGLPVLAEFCICPHSYVVFSLSVPLPTVSAPRG